jgi:hypothetical protein
MAADEVTVDHLVTDLDLDLNRLTGIVEEVAKHIRDGNPDGAAMVLGTQSGKIGRFHESYNALYEKLGGQKAGERAMQSGGK